MENSGWRDTLNIAFMDGVSLQRTDDTLHLALPAGRVPLPHLPPAVFPVLCRLHGEGIPRRQLLQEASGCGDVLVQAHIHYELQRWEQLGLLSYTALYGGRPLATLLPTSLPFRPAAIASQTPARRLSRFTCCRMEGDGMVVESPRGHGVIKLHDPGAAALVGALAQPRDADQLLKAAVTHLPGMTEAELEAFLRLLELAAVIIPVDDEGKTDEDTDPALRVWSFHDLLFHARSRMGRRRGPFGATFPFAAEIPPLPAVKPAPPTEGIELERPDLEAIAAADPPLTRVLESRRSLRTYAKTPITLGQLGEFLYRSCRVQYRFETPVPLVRGRNRSRVTLELTVRPSPSAGAIYDLETYAAVRRCEGLAPGLYHYDPLHHRLHLVRGDDERVQQLVQGAAHASRSSDPQVLIILAARFARMSWKYESIAYALTLKGAGALIQTMYLVATAMGLAPTAIGSGNSDLFAEAAGTNYYEETSVAEFLLGTRA